MGLHFQQRVADRMKTSKCRWESPKGPSVAPGPGRGVFGTSGAVPDTLKVRYFFNQARTSTVIFFLLTEYDSH